MKRRDFMTGMLSESAAAAAAGGDSNRSKISSVTEHSAPLTRAQVYHLLRRITFAPTTQMVDYYTGKTAAEAVEELLGNVEQPLPEKPGAWVDVIEEDPLSVGSNDIRFPIESRLKSSYATFSKWWLEQMRTDEAPVVEKFVLFWSTVWCVNFNYDTMAMMPPPLLYRNNQTIRDDHIGNYKTFAEDITLDGAMILYQSLYYSTKDIPNENYMRELMELFTMGIGHYTEGDIREGSRAFTGWRTAAYKYDPHYLDAPFETYFMPQYHDIQAKTFMGEAIPARDEASNTQEQVLQGEVRKVIEILFQKRPNAIADFICDKIYRYFVYSNTNADDAGFIAELAKVFVDNDFELKPVFKALFTSTHFFDEANMGVQIKPPPEFIVGMEQQLGVSYPNVKDAVFELDQELYNPPNVGSWEAYRTWISTATYPLRIKFGREIIDLVDDAGFVALAKRFADYNDPSQLTEKLVEYFLPMPVEADRLARYKTALLNGMDEAAWDGLLDGAEPNATAAAGIKNFVSTILLSPDFQLS